MHIKAARQGHVDLVKILVAAGANLGGSDVAGGYAQLAAKDPKMRKCWELAGYLPFDGEGSA